MRGRRGPTQISLPMKALSGLVLLAALMLPMVAFCAEDALTFEQLPETVQRTLNASHLGGTVSAITRSTADGRVIFEVEVTRERGGILRLRVDEAGSYIREEPEPLANLSQWSARRPEELQTIPRIQFSDLPPRVARTVEREAKGREVADIDREMWRGRVVYEIDFKDRGADARIHVAEDGALVTDERVRRGGLMAYFMGLQLEETPPAVQHTIRQVAGDRAIADLDRKGTRAEPYYRVEIKDRAGTQELRVAPDGRVLFDSRAAAAKPAK